MINKSLYDYKSWHETDLSKTVDMMLSNDAVVRIKAEYIQLNIRLTRLELFLSTVMATERPSDTKEDTIQQLMEQKEIMIQYKQILERRIDALYEKAKKFENDILALEETYQNA